jgi:hypothetical protein
MATHNIITTKHIRIRYVKDKFRSIHSCDAIPHFGKIYKHYTIQVSVINDENIKIVLEDTSSDINLESF